MKTFHRKEPFIRPGQVCRHLLFIHQGVFRYYVLAKGKDHTKDFAVDTQNRFCTAFTSLITQMPSQLFIEALEESHVSVWHYQQVKQTFDKSLPFQTFARRMAEGMYMRKEQREIALLRDPAEQRYLDFVTTFPDVIRRVPQHYVASYLGITPESLSRIRKQLMSKE